MDLAKLNFPDLLRAEADIVAAKANSIVSTVDGVLELRNELVLILNKIVDHRLSLDAAISEIKNWFGSDVAHTVDALVGNSVSKLLDELEQYRTYLEVRRSRPFGVFDVNPMFYRHLSVDPESDFESQELFKPGEGISSIPRQVPPNLATPSVNTGLQSSEALYRDFKIAEAEYDQKISRDNLSFWLRRVLTSLIVGNGVIAGAAAVAVMNGGLVRDYGVGLFRTALTSLIFAGAAPVVAALQDWIGVEMAGQRLKAARYEKPAPDQKFQRWSMLGFLTLRGALIFFAFAGLAANVWSLLFVAHIKIIISS